MKQLALACAVVAAMLFSFGGVANAYPPGGPNVTATPSTTAPDGSVTITAACTPGESVTFTLESSSVTVPCDAEDGQSGTATGIVTAPTAVGTFDGVVNGSVSGPLGSFTVTVQNSATAPAGGLPSTGSDSSSTITMVAMGLLVGGLGLFTVATIRRDQPTAA